MVSNSVSSVTFTGFDLISNSVSFVIITGPFGLVSATMNFAVLIPNPMPKNSPSNSLKISS